jgi:hypothetical protein
MGGWVAVTGIRNLLCHCYVGIIGNHAKSQLAPAVISKKVTVFDEFLAELEGTGQKMLSKNITNREPDFKLHLPFRSSFPQSCALGSS